MQFTARRRFRRSTFPTVRDQFPPAWRVVIALPEAKSFSNHIATKLALGNGSHGCSTSLLVLRRFTGSAGITETQLLRLWLEHQLHIAISGQDFTMAKSLQDHIR